MDRISGFFIPSAKRLKPETVYQKLKQYAVSRSQMHIGDRRIFRLDLAHEGVIKGIKSSIEVGKTVGLDKSVVVALFESESWYLACIRNKAGKVDNPLYIDGRDVAGVVEFSHG